MAPAQLTSFTPSGRASAAALEQQITAASEHVATSAVLSALGSVVMILNGQRQVVAINLELLSTLGVERPERLLGHRPGELMGCVHAHEGPDGCGTGEACADCGAVLAILASQRHDRPEQRECNLCVEKNGERRSMEFRARSTPLRCDEHRFLVLTLQDISAEKRLEVLQEVFLHDVTNVLWNLMGFCDSLQLVEAREWPELVEELRALAKTLFEMAKSQRELHELELGVLEPQREWSSLDELLGALDRLFARDALRHSRALSFEASDQGLSLVTDRGLLLRVLENMVRNALEATPEGGEVRLWCAPRDAGVEFKVWNEGEIPRAEQRRIFERYFTTKGGAGRGLGTYSMKLIGERCLRGQVGFDSSAEGTTFWIHLPRHLSQVAGEAPL